VFLIKLLIRLGLRFSSFDPFTEEGEIWKPQSQMKLGNLLSGERFKSKLKGLEKTGCCWLLLAAAGCCWSRGETAEPRSGARALRPFDFPEEPGVGKNPVVFEEESETQSSSPL